MGPSTGLVTRTVGLRASMVARVGRAQLHAQYSWMCIGVSTQVQSLAGSSVLCQSSSCAGIASMACRGSSVDGVPGVEVQTDAESDVLARRLFRRLAQDEAELDAAIVGLVRPGRGRVEAVRHVLVLLRIRLREGVGLGRAEVLDVLLRRHDFRGDDLAVVAEQDGRDACVEINVAATSTPSTRR